MHDHFYYTYILASRTHALYIGVTGNLERRMQEHRSREGKGFAARYACDRLVWFERHASPTTAITREKELKGWTRSRKIGLIERENQTWVDLSETWGGPVEPYAASAKEATADPSLRSG